MREIWTDDLAVLTKITELCVSTDGDIEPQRVLDAFPLGQHGAVRRSLHRWSDNDYIETVTTQGMGQNPQILLIRRVTEKGLRASGAWPEDAELLADRLLALLAERAENEPEPEKRSRYLAGLKGLGGMSRELLV